MQNYIIYKVQQNDTKQSISKLFNVPQKNIISDKDNLSNGDRVIVDLTKVQEYVVMPFDTLDSIANKFGTTPQQIASKNDIKAIFIGQRLLI